MTPEMMQEIEFEIAFVGKTSSLVRSLKAPVGTTIKDALTIAVESCEDLPRNARDHADVAVYGDRIQDLSRPVNAGERLEILRPLIVDPAEARRARAMEP